MLSWAAVMAMMPLIGGTKMEVPLHFQSFDQVHKAFKPYVKVKWTHARDAVVFLREYRTPSVNGSPFIGQFELADKSYAFFCRDQREGVWIDWNNDKVFADDEFAMRYEDPNLMDSPGRNQRAYTYKPSNKLKNIPHVFIQIEDVNISIIPGGWLVGTVPIGKGIKIGLVDFDMNGRYDDIFKQSKSPNGGDTFCVDWNGNGIFEVNYSASKRLQDNELLPYSDLIQLQGRFYELSISKDLKTVTVSPYKGPTAKLKFVGGKPTLITLSGKRMILSADVSKNDMEVPAQESTIERLIYQVNDTKGKAWQVSTSSTAKRNNPFLAAGKVTVVKVGAPLQVALNVLENEKGIHFWPDIIDAGGRTVSNVLDAKDERPLPPTLTITDIKGDVVKKLVFTYG